MKQVFVTASTRGSVNALLPVIKKLDVEYAVKTVGDRGMAKHFLKEGVKAEELSVEPDCETANYLLKKYKPSLILCGQSCPDDNHLYSLDQSIVTSAKEKGIKTISVSDFWTNRDLYFKNSTLPDILTVIDKYQQEIMLKQGFPGELLSVTGNPSFDNLADLRDRFTEQDREQVRTDLELNSENLILMYVSQNLAFYYGESQENPNYLGYTERTALADLVDSLNSINDDNISLLVKARETEDKGKLMEIATKYKGEIVYNVEYDTKRAVLATDIILSPFSTVLVEASYMDKLGISLQPGLQKEDFLVTNELRVTCPVYERSDVLPTIEKALFDKNFKGEYQKAREGFSTDGKATSRIVDLVRYFL